MWLRDVERLEELLNSEMGELEVLTVVRFADQTTAAEGNLSFVHRVLGIERGGITSYTTIADRDCLAKFGDGERWIGKRNPE